MTPAAVLAPPSTAPLPTTDARATGARAGTADGGQTLVAVTPGNGDSVATVPDTVELTFLQAPTGSVRVDVLGPGDSATQDTASVDGAVVTADVPQGGPGDYTVQYTLGPLTGETGFTVLAPGEAAPVQDAGTGAAFVSIAIAVALVAVAALTVRRWLTRGGGGRQ